MLAQGQINLVCNLEGERGCSHMGLLCCDYKTAPTFHTTFSGRKKPHLGFGEMQYSDPRIFRHLVYGSNIIIHSLQVLNYEKCYLALYTLYNGNYIVELNVTYQQQLLLPAIAAQRGYMSTSSKAACS